MHDEEEEQKQKDEDVAFDVRLAKLFVDVSSSERGEANLMGSSKQREHI